MTFEQTEILINKIKYLEELNSNDQKIKKKLNILKSVYLYLVKDKDYIKDISEELNLSTSCIQRYLNDLIIEKELGIEVSNEISEKLKQSKQNGNIEGGIQYVKRNIAIKKVNGKFNGSVPRIN